jgi:hypothetical protein
MAWCSVEAQGLYYYYYYYYCFALRELDLRYANSLMNMVLRPMWITDINTSSAWSQIKTKYNF